MVIWSAVPQEIRTRVLRLLPLESYPSIILTCHEFEALLFNHQIIDLQMNETQSKMKPRPRIRAVAFPPVVPLPETPVRVSGHLLSCFVTHLRSEPVDLQIIVDAPPADIYKQHNSDGPYYILAKVHNHSSLVDTHSLTTRHSVFQTSNMRSISLEGGFALFHGNANEGTLRRRLQQVLFNANLSRVTKVTFVLRKP